MHEVAAAACLAQSGHCCNVLCVQTLRELCSLLEQHLLQVLFSTLRSPFGCAGNTIEVSNSSVTSLFNVIEAQSVHQELQSISFNQAHARQHEQDQGTKVGQGQAPAWQEGLCGMSLLPLQTLQLPLTPLPSGQLCLVSPRPTNTMYKMVLAQYMQLAEYQYRRYFRLGTLCITQVEIPAIAQHVPTHIQACVNGVGRHLLLLQFCDVAMCC